MQWRLTTKLVRVSGLAACLVAAALWAATPAHALVQVTLDAETITDFLRTATPKSIAYALPALGNVQLELTNVRVTGFEPAAGNGKGHVLAALTVRIPQLKLEFPVEPRLSLELESKDGQHFCVLRFEKLTIPLLQAGGVDIGSLMPVYRVPAEAAWTVALREGDVAVKSRLVETRLGSDGIRLGFDIDLAPVKEK